jgi:hypothetical protein
VGLVGREVSTGRHGRHARELAPGRLSDRALNLSSAVAARCGAAQLGVARGAEAMAAGSLGRLLLRAEAIASSSIEGVTAPLVDVVLAEHGSKGAPTGAKSIASNLAAAEQAITHAAGASPLTLDELCTWHTTLTAGSPPRARHVGVSRDERVGMGGLGPVQPLSVSPQVSEFDGLLGDLLTFVNESELDPIAAAAIAHAQFEAIHPFAVGNGRIGRVLVSWLLTRRLHLLTPPPVSVSLSADVVGYTLGLAQYRSDQTSSWVAWFADAVASAAEVQQQVAVDVDRIRSGWNARLAEPRNIRALRTDAAAWRVIDLVPRHLVLTIAVVAEELQVTRKAAGDALRILADAGILTPHGTAVRVGRGRPAHVYVSEELRGLSRSEPARSLNVPD